MRCASQSKRPSTAGRAARALAEERRPVVPDDQYWAEPVSSSLKYAVEAHSPKPANAGVVVGAAHAPRGKPGPYFGVSLSVGRLKKMVAFAGTLDGACQKSRAPHVPKDLDSLPFCAASPDQDYPGFLKGGEPAELIDFSPAWVRRFALPTCELELRRSTSTARSPACRCRSRLRCSSPTRAGPPCLGAPLFPATSACSTLKRPPFG